MRSRAWSSVPSTPTVARVYTSRWRLVPDGAAYGDRTIREPPGRDPTGGSRELRLQRGAGRAPAHRPQLPRRQVARGHRPRADGDRVRLRRGRLEPDGPGDGPAGPHHPRGVRRPGLHLRRADRGARGDGQAPALRPVLLHRRPRRQRPAALGTDEAKQAHLPGIAAGETIATLALTEANGRWDAEGITLEGGDTLTGEKMFVLDGHTANLILVVAKTAGGFGIYAVDGDASGLTRTPLSTMDQTRKQAKLTFDNTPATLIGRQPAAGTPSPRSSTSPRWRSPPSRSAARRSASTWPSSTPRTACSSAGPIGSFQAIKHKCADMLLEVESAKSAAYYAGWCAAELNDELPGRQPGQGLLLRGLLPRLGREHPDPRWHRLHLGAPGSPVLQAGQVLRAALRRSRLPPRAARPAHRHLIDRSAGRTWWRSPSGLRHRRVRARRRWPPGTHRPVLTVVLVVGAVLVFAIAAVAVGRVTAGLAGRPNAAVYDPDQSLEFVAEALPERGHRRAQL
jgi:hypothetical protein